MKVTPVTSEELFNLLQHQKNWPSGGPPVVFDLRPAEAYAARHMRGAHHASVSADGSIVAPAKSWWDRIVCVYDEEPSGLEDHPVSQTLLREGLARELLVLSEPYDAFQSAFKYLCARGDSKSAMKRPLYPSCVIPGLLYLGDLADAAALPRLREHLNVTHTVTALAELTPSLKASVAESRVKHTWCNVRDVEEADIKEHFEKAYDVIERARAEGSAVFVHCSRGVSRSASLCIAYLMRREGGRCSPPRHAACLPSCRALRVVCSTRPSAPCSSVTHPTGEVMVWQSWLDHTAALLAEPLPLTAHPLSGWDAKHARSHVESRRPIILPNEGFWRCLQEYEKERSGGRSGVYVPAKTKPLEELEVGVPPPGSTSSGQHRLPTPRTSP